MVAGCCPASALLAASADSRATGRIRARCMIGTSPVF
jgi:hypothetical protein